jgi:hypothetical protein
MNQNPRTASKGKEEGMVRRTSKGPREREEEELASYLQANLHGIHASHGIRKRSFAEPHGWEEEDDELERYLNPFRNRLDFEDGTRVKRDTKGPFISQALPSDIVHRCLNP